MLEHENRTEIKNEDVDQAQPSQDQSGALSLADNRPEAAQLKRLSGLISRSDRHQNLVQLQSTVDAHLAGSANTLLDSNTDHGQGTPDPASPLQLSKVMQFSLTADEQEQLEAKAMKYVTQKGYGIIEKELQTELLAYNMVYYDVDSAFTDLKKLIDDLGYLSTFWANPASIWGMTHEDFDKILLRTNWDIKKYTGESTAYSYTKVIGGTQATITFNYGGGLHSHALDKQVFDTPYYYKMEGAIVTKKTKILDAKIYPEKDILKESYQVIDGPTQSVIKA